MRIRQVWARRFACVLALGGLGAVLTTGGCTLTTNTTAIQCLSEAECQSKGPDFKNTTCDSATKTCVPIVNVAGCTTNQDCISAANAPSLCRKSDKKCVLLASAECPTVFGKPAEILDDTSVIIGAFTPANEDQRGAMMEKSLGLVQDDISKNAIGLPPTTTGGKPRPVIIVGCNEFGSGIEGLLRAGNHLVKDLGVSVIVGPLDSQNAIQIAAQITLPNKVMNILPTSVVSGLSQLPNPADPVPIIWRMGFSDAALSAAAAQSIPYYLEQHAKDLNIIQTTEATRIMLITEGSVVGIGLAQLVQGQLKFNGGKTALENQTDGNYMLGNIGDQRDPLSNPNPAATTAKVVAAALAFKPHIIIHTSNLIGVTSVFIPIEVQWAAANPGVPLPLHLTVLGGSWGVAPLFQFIGANTSRQQRTFATRGKAVAVDVTTQSTWDARFRIAYPEFATAAPSSLVYAVFDAGYIATFAAAGVGAAPLNGVNAATVLMNGRINPPNAVAKADPAELAKNLTTLGGGGAVDFLGIGGDYNFDAKGGAPTSDTELQCINVPTTVATGLKPSGVVWDHNTNTLSGTVAGCP